MELVERAKRLEHQNHAECAENAERVEHVECLEYTGSAKERRWAPRSAEEHRGDSEELEVCSVRGLRGTAWEVA